ncbi:MULTISPECIES: hypothetical protein [Bacteria]|uniref:hypothetical protein n=1 Tax=Bacteria TaxID=2 RepID=UPI003EE5A27D
MKFKDVLKKDIEKTFLDIEKLAEELEIDGVKHKGVLDSKENVETKVESQGIYNTDISILYILYSEELRKRCKKGRSIEINERTYVIESVAEQLGMLVVKLSENTGF